MAPPRTPCCPRSGPVLMEELVEEILLRIQPDEPAHLVGAALVCKPWLRILTDPVFLRRYRAFHRAPPLLGYIQNLEGINLAGAPTLAPTSARSPLSTMTLPPEFEHSWPVLDCRHGRVLIHAFGPPEYLVVWDPITGSLKKLSLPNYDHEHYAGAVLCAVDGCDHLDCHDGPFLVVFAGSGGDGYEFETGVTTYTSETGQWTAPITINDSCFLSAKPTLLIRDTIYFIAKDNILKFDLGAHELSVIESRVYQAIPMEVDGGGLAFASMYGNYIYMLLWQDYDDDGTGGWEEAEHLGVELETRLPRNPYPNRSDLVGLLEGTNTVFISIPDVGLFTLDLKSRKVKQVAERGAYGAILPYTGFYTPDLAKGTHHQLHEDAKIGPPT